MNPTAPSRILLVDDNRVNRLLGETRLREQGYEVLSAAGGREALDLLKDTLEDRSEHPPIDLAVLDIIMPEVDGFEVLRGIRKAKSHADLPVVMATAVEQPEDVVKALQSGANDYVVKPINYPVLVARIETQLSLKNARHALKKAQESLILTAKMESISFLAAGVAHEIRNPLSRIQLGLQSLQRHPLTQTDEKLARSASSIKAACDKADEVVGQLMKLAAESRPTLEALDIHVAIEDALVLIGGLIDAQNIELQRDFSPSLPEARYGLPELRQILVNVILNAVQAMPDGGTVSIRTGLRTLETVPSEMGGRSGNLPRRGDEMIFIDVEDDGPGLPHDKLLTAFDAFYTTKPAGLAPGLGLTIARKMLELQGGLISLRNREEGGARASILIPKSTGFQTTV